MRRLWIYPLSRSGGDVISPIIGDCSQIAVSDRQAVVFYLNEGD
jgi:hypothetical protein